MQLEAANYPIREIETLAEGDDQVDLAAILVPTSAEPAELDTVVSALKRDQERNLDGWYRSVITRPATAQGQTQNEPFRAGDHSEVGAGPRHGTRDLADYSEPASARATRTASPKSVTLPLGDSLFARRHFRGPEPACLTHHDKVFDAADDADAEPAVLRLATRAPRQILLHRRHPGVPRLRDCYAGLYASAAASLWRDAPNPVSFHR